MNSLHTSQILTCTSPVWSNERLWPMASDWIRQKSTIIEEKGREKWDQWKTRLLFKHASETYEKEKKQGRDSHWRITCRMGIIACEHCLLRAIDRRLPPYFDHHSIYRRSADCCSTMPVRHEMNIWAGEQRMVYVEFLTVWWLFNGILLVYPMYIDGMLFCVCVQLVVAFIGGGVITRGGT